MGEKKEKQTKRKTVAEQREWREERQHQKITAAAKYAEETGKCPVCRVREKAHGITCGDIDCMKAWISGRFK